jgi:hypothetical protein
VWERSGHEKAALLIVGGDAGLRLYIFLCPPEDISSCDL